MLDTAITGKLPAVIRNLWTAQQALAGYYADTALKFTLDARLVGDIAEAIALQHFDRLLPQSRTGGGDAMTRTGKTVQVKATGNLRSGPAFTLGKGCADYPPLLRHKFRGQYGIGHYNGPESPVRALLPAQRWAGTKVIPLADMHRLAKNVAPSASIAYAPRSTVPIV